MINIQKTETNTVMGKSDGYDLKDRLIDYSVRIIALSEALPDTKAG